jgi:hypothetical protein
VAEIGPVVTRRVGAREDGSAETLLRVRAKSFVATGAQSMEVLINAWLDERQDIEIVSAQLAGGASDLQEAWTEALIWYREPVPAGGEAGASDDA